MKSVSNLDLTRSNARSRRKDFDCTFFIHVGTFCVELRPFYCKKRISVPMSYISFWKHISYDTPGLRSEGYPCEPPTLKTKVGRVPLPKLGMTLIRVPTVRPETFAKQIRFVKIKDVILPPRLTFFGSASSSTLP